ncbi:efflux RND transporter periplasmic adaptor subunit [Criblamydia sequanensis]|uniref:Multidrug efflux transporter n=1 Tax=Candidatus Criblamydia sequanensis CRIB-18 TaxID=1437425 RepID=A0A090CZ78_9BACT|nr:efflux RND transporter periplasmic adaptor subunit [Criblamydia sequanensis]CDR34086.1 Multidrug efflux transporter [Criblamydia sequanensis CRIB-18]
MFASKQSLTLFTLIILLTSCKKEEVKVQPKPVAVTALKIETKTIPAEYRSMGVVLSSHLVDIRSQVEGQLEKIAYKEGDYVKRGTLLFIIDQRPFIAAVENAKAEVARQEAILWDAQKTYERIAPLFEQKAASRRDYENAYARQLESEAAVLAAKAKLDEAVVNLGYTVIRSPVDGLTTQSNYREGALIHVQSTQPLTTVSVVDPAWIQFTISEGDVLRINEDVAQKRLILPDSEDYKVEVTLADGSIYPEKGEFYFTSPIYDMKTGTLLLRATIANPSLILRPGQFVRANVSGALRPNAITVPQRAVTQSQQGAFVFIINDEQKADIRYVELGSWYKEDWIINAGLQKGDVIVVDGINKIRKGTPVTVIPDKNSNDSKNDSKEKTDK